MQCYHCKINYSNFSIQPAFYYKCQTVISQILLMSSLFIFFLLFLVIGLTFAYDNGAPVSKLPPLGWSSWVALGPGNE